MLVDHFTSVFFVAGMPLPEPDLIDFAAEFIRLDVLNRCLIVSAAALGLIIHL
jgi:hypothetical protein